MYRSGHNEAVSKTVSQRKLARGFESHSLRQQKIKEETNGTDSLLLNLKQKGSVPISSLFKRKNIVKKLYI